MTATAKSRPRDGFSDGVIAQLVRAHFFQQKPPRTAGREEFGREYVGRFLQICRGASKTDVVATATALTARSIADAVQRFVCRDLECGAAITK